MSQPVQLPGFLLALAPLLDHWGYLAVGFLLFVEDFGVPAPGRDRADRSVCLRRCRAAEHRRRRRDRLRRRSARPQHRLRDRTVRRPPPGTALPALRAASPATT